MGALPRPPQLGQTRATTLGPAPGVFSTRVAAHGTLTFLLWSLRKLAAPRGVCSSLLSLARMWTVCPVLWGKLA